jgi:hypothetical protein
MASNAADGIRLLAPVLINVGHHCSGQLTATEDGPSLSGMRVTICARCTNQYEAAIDDAPRRLNHQHCFGSNLQPSVKHVSASSR